MSQKAAEGLALRVRKRGKLKLEAIGSLSMHLH